MSEPSSYTSVGALEASVVSRTVSHIRNKYSKSRLTSALVREAPAVRRMTSYATSGTSEFLGDSLQSAAVLGVCDLARNAAAARGVRHQHRIAPSQRKVSRQRSPFVAALLLDDLNQQDLPALDDFLNLVLAAQARRTARKLLEGVAADLLDCLAFVLDVRNAGWLARQCASSEPPSSVVTS